MGQNTITKEDREILAFVAEDLKCTVSEVIETLKYNCVLESLSEQRAFLKERKELECGNASKLVEHRLAPSTRNE